MTQAMNDLITKHRPKTLDDVIGQPAVVKSLRDVIKAKSARSFLFTGPAGTGKTTLARIVARAFECESILEIDAATHSGIEEMRSVIESLAYRGMSGKGRKMVIVDEAHALSKSAVTALLKIMEEPPAHLYWALATTEGDKIPEAIRTRCVRYQLAPVSDDDITALLTKVARAEGLTAPPDILGLLARKAQGSPRRALSSLAAAGNCTSKDEALRLLNEVALDSKEVVELCRAFMQGKPAWSTVMELLAKIDTRNPEGIRIVMCAYFSKVARNPKYAGRALEIMSAFETPYPQTTGEASLLLSLGRLVFTE